MPASGLQTFQARRFRPLPLIVVLVSASIVHVRGDEPTAAPPIHDVVDDYLNQKLKADGIKPAERATDSCVIRRTTLDLAGRIPTAAEAKAYVESSDPDKRRKLVDRLMDSPDFSYHQRNTLDAMLLPDSSDNDFRAYLLEAVRENRGWDRMFREMIGGVEKPVAAAASTDDDPPPPALPESPGDGNPREAQAAAVATAPSDARAVHKGAAVFLKKRVRSPDDMTNDVSSLFFGVSINCAMCHDHPLVEDWKQDHYFGMKSFFDRTYLTKKDTLAEKYSGVIKFKTTAGEEKQARFMFLTGAAIDEPDSERTAEQRKKEDVEVKRQREDKNAPPPAPPVFSPRRRLVELALRDDEQQFFARSIVNRVWTRLMGRGLVDPPDQMHSGNPASHPELLAWLARDLVAHDYDLKRVVRGIVESDAYIRSSRWTGEGQPPDGGYFAVAKPRTLSPRQYALSLFLASRNPEQYPLDWKPDEWAKRREQLENAANGYANEFEQPTEHFQVSVDEALLFTNSQRVRNDFLHDGGDRLLGRLKQLRKDGSSDAELIETACWSILSRRPEAEELTATTEYLKARSDRPDAALRQVVWALLTSPEVRFNY